MRRLKEPILSAAPVGQSIPKKASGVGSVARGNLLGSSCGHHPTALIASLRTQIDDPIRALDHLEIVLNDNQTLALVDETMKHSEQSCDVVEVQAGGRFIKDKQRAGSARFRKVPRQLEALRFSTAQGVNGLTEAKIIETHLGEEAERHGDAFVVLEKAMASPTVISNVVMERTRI